MTLTQEGITVAEVRKQMELAMLEGLNNPDPAIQARWKMIPCKGDIPTPEELITYIADSISKGINPFI